MRNLYWDAALVALLLVAALAHVHGAVLAPSGRETPHATPAHSGEPPTAGHGPSHGVFIRPATSLWEEGGTTRV